MVPGVRDRHHTDVDYFDFIFDRVALSMENHINKDCTKKGRPFLPLALLSEGGPALSAGAGEVAMVCS
jgi:hypothetical protein